MYKNNSQLRIEDFVFPYGKLDPENDWVKLAALVPWEIAEERYAARFVNNGHPAHPARMALGALLIQRRLKCSDQWLVKHIGENPYLQYFIGMKEYGPCPFGASTLVAFRKRFSEEDLAAILEASVPKAETGKQDDSDDGNDPPNSGTLILDATCCPADIAYPQDIDLLNQVREKAEKTVDELCKAAGQKKPRMYRKRARKDYLRLSKSKKRSGKAIRSAIRKQLQYIRRDIRYIAELVQKGAKLSSKQADRLNIMTTVYEQQRLMFESGTHSIPRRIVSLAQPWVRPIVRGKAHANTEFGSKLHISLVDGYARIERLDFEPFNESEDLWRAVARYRERYGCYPERILADKIYRSRQTLAFCKEHGIRLSGPALGKPPKAPGLSRQAKKLEYQDNCDRNAVEGVFGTVKTAYGLDRVMARLQETAICVIGVALLLSNLAKSLRAALTLFGRICLLVVLPWLRSRAYVGFTALTFCRWERTPGKNQAETPYTKEGRQIHFERTKKKKIQARLDEMYSEKTAQIILHGKWNKLNNFEFIMNRAYALNRDKLKCRVCGGWLISGTPYAHRINPNLPLNKVNRVNNLVSLHKKCFMAVNDPNYDINQFDVKAQNKIIGYREKLVISHTRNNQSALMERRVR